MVLKGYFRMKDGYLVKICGTTNIEDALLAAREGADYFGVVIEVSFSPRSLTIEEAGDLFNNPLIPAVALVFHMGEQRLEYLINKLRPFAIQFLSQEDPEVIKRLKLKFREVKFWQSIHLKSTGEDFEYDKIKIGIQKYLNVGIDLLLFDTVATVDGIQKFGGTGQISDWKLVKQLFNDIDAQVPVLLAGGINPENVAEALDTINPDGVDLCSGVESVKGIKDPEKVRKLIRIVKAN
jgi:phosphoribosylanthranilate isomerase